MSKPILLSREEAASVRYKIPRYQYTIDGDSPSVVWDKFLGRAFVFKSDDYLTEEQIKRTSQKTEEQKEIQF
jgi:hypothetical protein